jgi:hypothetical protein
MANKNDFRWVPCNSAVSKAEACFFEIGPSDELRRVHDMALARYQNGHVGAPGCIEHLWGVDAADTLPVIQIE